MLQLPPVRKVRIDHFEEFMNKQQLAGIAKYVLIATGTLALARKLRSRLRARTDDKPLPPIPQSPAEQPVPKTPPAAEIAPVDPAYSARVAAEIATFENDEIVHDLPAIFHYWSNKYLLPTIRPFGFINPDDFFIRQLAACIEKHRPNHCDFISIGAGNCDTEVRIVEGLRLLGHDNFTLECLDLNPTMLERGRTLAKEHGMSGQLVPIEGDFNNWRAAKPYHAVLANQSLHHVLKLEILFDTIHAAIAETGGLFITSDMIGRNGHMRWPEALAIVEEFWNRLPGKYKYNRQLRRQEDSFVNWDCSTDGFEGIRAQDIMPLLLERFHFDLFVPFSNVISPFIDRSFGPNFDADTERDRALIDDIHARDELEIRAGNIKPTQMFAVLSLDRSRPTQHIAGLAPDFCVRRA
jgi:hypothetical protein